MPGRRYALGQGQGQGPGALVEELFYLCRSDCFTPDDITFRFYSPEFYQFTIRFILPVLTAHGFTTHEHGETSRSCVDRVKRSGALNRGCTHRIEVVLPMMTA